MVGLIERIKGCRRKAVRFIRRFHKDDRGAMAVLVALTFIPLLIAGGMAIDLSLAYTARARLQKAIDVAGLAVGTKANDQSVNLTNLFNSYFNINYPSSKYGTPKNVSFSVTNGVVAVSAEVDVPTVFMKLIGVDSMAVAADATIIARTTGIELVMVLDNTGSMSGSRLSDLKTAATDMIDILFGDEATPEKIKVALVPFAGSVNIGSTNTSYITDPLAFNWGPTSWDGCVEALTYPNDVEDNSVLWTPFNWADTNNSYNNWYYWSWWSSAWIYSIDTSPPSGRGPNKYCPRPLTPLTNNKATLLAEINAMWATGYTHINNGAVWGLRVISPGVPFTEGAPYNDPDWTKAAIIMTDGENTTSDSVYTAYGYRSEGRLNGQTSSWGTKAELDIRLSEVCTAMKAENIKVYTITFQVSDTDTQNLMESCATNPDNYFNSPSTSALQSAFQAIGAELKSLHLSQ